MPRFNGAVTVHLNTSLNAVNKLVARDRLQAMLSEAFAAPEWLTLSVEIKLDEIGVMPDN